MVRWIEMNVSDRTTVTCWFLYTRSSILALHKS